MQCNYQYTSSKGLKEKAKFRYKRNFLSSSQSTYTHIIGKALYEQIYVNRDNTVWGLTWLRSSISDEYGDHSNKMERLCI